MTTPSFAEFIGQTASGKGGIGGPLDHQKEVTFDASRKAGWVPTVTNRADKTPRGRF